MELCAVNLLNQLEHASFESMHHSASFGWMLHSAIMFNMGYHTALFIPLRYIMCFTRQPV
jgi:hypothetical protein